MGRGEGRAKAQQECTVGERPEGSALRTVHQDKGEKQSRLTWPQAEILASSH